jgi:hypothetical protein
MFRFRRPPERSPSQERPYYRWEDPQGRIRVDLNLNVVDGLRRDVEAASIRNDGRGAEIGGLLLGRRGNPVRIEAFQPIVCEHRRGPSYALTIREKKVLARSIEKTRGYDVVGYFRSHTRTGLYLDQEDFSLMQEFFGDPSQVALVVKPWAGHGQIAGFFFWEDGDIHRRATYLQFPFESSELEAKSAEPADAPVVPVEAAPVVVAPLPATSPTRLAVIPPPAAATGFLKRPRVRAAALMAAGALGVVALGLSAVRLLPVGKHAPPAGPRNDIALTVNRTQDGVRVTWNQDSRTLASMRGATLRIRDGERERIVTLDERQVRMGSITYFPLSDAVTVRLDPGIQAVSNAPAEPPPPVQQPEPPPVQTARAAPSKKPQPRPFAADGLLENRSDSADRVALEPPPRLSPAMLPRLAPVLISPEQKLPPALARVSYEPVQSNALRKVVNRIPGLRRLQKRQYRNVEDFRAAAPVRTAAPAIPAGVAREGAEVGLKILIDKAGDVQRAEVVSKGSEGSLEDLALSSVQSWKFAPARLAEEPVESEMIVRFDFDPVSSSAHSR